ncbi:MAG: hypothetical protein ACREFM_06800 [Hypericibacter sp.]
MAHATFAGVLAVLFCLTLSASDGNAQNNSGSVTQDEYQTQGDPGDSGGGDSFSTGDVPGGEEGGPCEDTSQYDRVYGGPPVRISLKSLGDPIYQRHPEILLRCAADRCAINETALCWINKKALAAARQDPAVSDEYNTQSDDSDPNVGCPALSEWTAEQQAWWNKTYCSHMTGGGSGGGSDSYNTGNNGPSTNGNGGGGSGSGGGGSDSYDTTGNQPPDGSKSIYREEPDPDPSGKFTADIRKMAGVMDDCLRRKGGMDFYRSPVFRSGRGTISYDPNLRSITFGVGWLKQMDPYDRAYALGNAVAAHVLALEARRYGDKRSSWERQHASDYLTGFLAHCVERRGLLPTPTNADNMLEDYQAYVLQYGFPTNSTDLEAHAVNFNEGWEAWEMQLPDWLTHTPD